MSLNWSRSASRAATSTSPTSTGRPSSSVSCPISDSTRRPSSPRRPPRGCRSSRHPCDRTSAVAVVDDLGVDDLVVIDRSRAAGGAILAGGRSACCVGVAGRGLVELLAERLAGVHQRLAGLSDGADVVAVERLLEVAQWTLDR